MILQKQKSAKILKQIMDKTFNNYDTSLEYSHFKLVLKIMKR